jgi:hypothetical protein
MESNKKEKRAISFWKRINTINSIKDTKKELTPPSLEKKE